MTKRLLVAILNVLSLSLFDFASDFLALRVIFDILDTD